MLGVVNKVSRPCPCPAIPELPWSCMQLGICLLCSTPYLGAPGLEGGFGLKVMSHDRREVFFFGIIDFLSPYTARRYLHTIYKRAKSSATYVLSSPMLRALDACDACAVWGA